MAIKCRLESCFFRLAPNANRLFRNFFIDYHSALQTQNFFIKILDNHTSDFAICLMALCCPFVECLCGIKENS